MNIIGYIRTGAGAMPIWEEEEVDKITSNVNNNLIVLTPRPYNEPAPGVQSSMGPGD